MAEEEVLSDADLIREAVRSLDLGEQGSWAEVERLVTRRALLLRRLQKPTSLPMRTLTAVPILAKVLSIEEGHDRSTRLYVTYRTLKDGKVEHVRTDRTDGPGGAAVKRLWDKSLADPEGNGPTVVIYKTNEGASGTGAGAQGYRNAPFVTLAGRVR